MPPPGGVVAVAPERLAGWLDRFARQHGGLDVAGTADADGREVRADAMGATDADGREVRLAAADGALACCEVPFPPLRADGQRPAVALVAHACRQRRVGVLLVRLGGYATGVFDGERLVASKVGARLVHGRSAAGGQSQRRFARRREGQARLALAAAADTAVRVLLPAAPGLDAVVLGGDRRAVAAVLDDPRLAALRPLVVDRLLDVPDPRQRVLLSAPALFRAVRIRVVAPPPD